ncbi:unnamed protein product [Ceutorhynchus assimilis]|uniref:Uncharacterized protein n=1 Tax=Ceutorhynchus assimilis TaxID=467358 RepID=A0A9N9MHQ6_9CUCU|nr:unnamed protein product [Ceutorhynchus assimilis]
MCPRMPLIENVSYPECRFKDIEISFTLSAIETNPEPTTENSNSTNQLPTDSNATSSAVSFLDVRTPPKIQNFIKDKMANRTIEQSHAGVAIPLEDDDILEESTKKMNFYKLDRPTTNGGLSTWILLSGQTSTKPTTTKKPSVKPIILKDEKNNETLMLSDKPMKIVKPAFKQRSTTTKPVKTTTKPIVSTTTVRINTFSPKNTTRKPITKVKASLLQNNNTTKNTTTISTTTVATTTTTIKLPITNLTSASLPVEAKNSEQELETTTEKKKKKKKKNKRRNKPEKKDANAKLKETAGTQLYSYLRSEIIPVTVGFSLVGLLVTAGLASYYLQPFAALRRHDQIDRKDTEGNYYYRDEYSNAVPEEEAIGKVIAGMPESSLQPKLHSRYRHVDRRSQIHMNPYGSVEDVKLNPKEITPAVVPEHGPRDLKQQKFVVGNIPKEYLVNSIGGSPRYLRRRRQIQDDAENEIDDDNQNKSSDPDSHTTKSSDEFQTTTLPNVINSSNEKPSTLFELLSDLFKLKVKLGLELMQNVTNSVSSYVTRVQSRLDEHYRVRTRHNNVTIS